MRFIEYVQESTMPLVRNELYRYQGLNGMPSEAWIRVYDNRPHPVAVICSQTATSPGTSVSNAAEGLATSIWYELGQPAGFLWIEHYAPESQGTLFKDHFYQLVLFALVNGAFSSPEWIRVTQAQVKQIVRGSMQECDEAAPMLSSDPSKILGEKG